MKMFLRNKNPLFPHQSQPPQPNNKSQYKCKCKPHQLWFNPLQSNPRSQRKTT